MDSPALSIFPKAFGHIPLDDLGPMLRDARLEMTNLVVRAGFWCEEGNLAESVPRFCRAMSAAGIAVAFSTWTLDPDKLVEAEEELRVLAENGIAQVRIGYFQWRDGSSFAMQLAAAREALSRAVPILARAGVRAVYQVHHGTLVTNPESAAILVEGLPVEQIGIMLDAGNQGHEGGAKWKRAAQILGAHWTALGVKDYVRERQGEPGSLEKGSSMRWASCAEGMTNWPEVRDAWATAERSGPWVMQPFYHGDDFTRFRATLRDEVAFLKQVLAA